MLSNQTRAHCFCCRSDNQVSAIGAHRLNGQWWLISTIKTPTVQISDIRVGAPVGAGSYKMPLNK